MDLNWEQYHRFNVILLSAVGLWPHRHTSLLRLQRIFASVISITCMCGNLASFVTMGFTKTLLLKNAPTVFMEFAMFLKYISYRLASDCIKAVTKSINSDWKALSNKEEIGIIEKYVERGKFHTRSFAMFVFPAVVCLILAPFTSEILDIVVPLNQSRAHYFPLVFDPLFCDQDEDFPIVVFGFVFCVIFVGLIFVSTEALLIVYVHHACALFAVTSRRIKKLLRATVANDSKRNNHVVLMTQVVEIHVRAIRYCEIIRENLLRSYLFLLVLGTLSMSAHLFRGLETFAARDFLGVLTATFFCLANLGYICYINFVLQTVRDSSIDIFDDLYNSEWYEFPITTQKLVLFCMLSTTKPVSMDFSSLFHPSYEGVTTILKMVMSYVTALNSFK